MRPNTWTDCAGAEESACTHRGEGWLAAARGVGSGNCLMINLQPRHIHEGAGGMGGGEWEPGTEAREGRRSRNTKDRA